YVVATVFLLVFGFITYAFLHAGNMQATLQPAMYNSTFILLIIAPALTMRLFAEEKSSGTIEVLMTAPVRDWEVVGAKFLAALTTFGVMLVPTLAHVL
ncbi:unnamed protein product, partial [marine sediment metagenome]